MNIENDLKKDGIEVVGKLDTLSINTLAHDVAQKLCKAFPEQNFIFQNLFISLSRIPMYVAKMPNGFAEANYLYKNSSIYFKAGVPTYELEKYAIHEFIHYLQEIKDKKNRLVKLGLCDFGNLKVQGMALNEGAVQLMASKALNQEQEIVKYYEISLPTNSPNYYPILCNLVAQMAYITGENLLFDSTLYGSDLFKETFSNLCGINALMKIQNYLDNIMNTEEKIIILSNKLLEDDCEGIKAQKIASKISKLKDKLKKLYFTTQDLIYTSYFNSEFERIKTTADIDSFRFKLYNYKNYIGIAENYSNFNDFYINKMIELDNKYETIMNSTAVAVVDNSKIGKFFRKIKTILTANVQLQK